VSWIYQSEIFPMNMRALGASVSTASNWMNNVIIAQVTPYGFTHLGYKYFIVYICTCISNTVIVYFFYPETKGKTLEEIGKHCLPELSNAAEPRPCRSAVRR